MNRTRQPTACALGVLALACGALGGCEPDSSQVLGGELGAGTFIYLCDSPSDAQCDEGETVAEVAFRGLALHGVFGVGYDPHTATIESASTERIDYDESAERWQALATGWAALIAMTSTGAEDLIHARVFEATGVRISQRDISGTFTGSFGGVSIDVSVQGSITLRVAPVDADDNVLAGALSCSWTTSNAAVADITSDPTDNVITVDPKMAGSATLDVELGSLTGQTTIVVN